MSLDRRTFILSAIGATVAACGHSVAAPTATGTILDAHVHLFGAGDGGSGCFLSHEQKQHANFAFFKRLLDLEEGEAMDETYVQRLMAQLDSSLVDKVLLYSQDGRYDDRGEFLRDETHFYVPNDYLFEICKRDPARLLPCISINPKRKDAIEEARRCRALGAVAVKVHPPTQDVDPADPAFIPFWETLAEIGLVLVVHTGTEHASHVTSFETCDPARLEPALKAGCTVIAAHAGFGSFLDGEDFFPSLQRLVREYDKLYCDTAVLASTFRWRNLPRLIEDKEVLARAIHGSDWPFPSNPVVFWHKVAGTSLASMLGEENLFTRDLQLKRALGLSEASIRRGGQLFGV